MNINNVWKSKSKNSEIGDESRELFNGIYIPQEYRRKVLKHLILNYSSNINGLQPSLFLAIQGVKGEGKTYMLQTICENYNIETIFISGSDLCGPNEGDSKNKIKQEYERACIRASQTKRLFVIIIDDFHLSIASNLGESVSKTTNAQVLVGYLMNLADNPYLYNVRIPIILLGNNFKNIYPALIRNGRMDFFDWVPEFEEKVRIIYFMYKKFYPQIEYKDVEELAKKYPQKNIAFFKDVIQDLFFSYFDSILEEFETLKGRISLDEINLIVEKYFKVNNNISSDCILEIASKRNIIKEGNFE